MVLNEIKRSIKKARDAIKAGLNLTKSLPKKSRGSKKSRCKKKYCGKVCECRECKCCKKCCKC